MAALSKALRSLLLAPLVLLAASGKAGAATLTFTSGEFTQSPFGVVLSGNFLGDNNPFDLGPWAGQMTLHSLTGDTFLGWCVDIFHDLNVDAISPVNSATYTVSALTADSSGSTFATSNTLSAQQAHDALALANYGNQQLAALSPGFQHDVFSGEVQIAIWSVIYAGRLSVSTYGPNIGGMSAGDFLAAINSLVAQAPNLDVGTAVSISNLDDNGVIQSQTLVGTFQDFLVPVGGGDSPSSIPEPAPFMLMGAVLLGLMCRRKVNLV